MLAVDQKHLTAQETLSLVLQKEITRSWWVSAHKVLRERLLCIRKGCRQVTAVGGGTEKENRRNHIEIQREVHGEQ